MLVNLVRWRVPKESSRRLLEIWREMMEWQRAHPEKVTYTRSRPDARIRTWRSALLGLATDAGMGTRTGRPGRSA